MNPGTLTDTGPLVALINRNDPNHRTCLNASRRLPAGPLLTTWPCFTEAMYLVHHLADASLVVVAESFNLQQVFTLDSDFYAYRLGDGSALEVVPQAG